MGRSSPEYMTQWRAKNPEKLAVYRARDRERVRSDPARWAAEKAYGRKWKLARYGLSPETYAAMVESQFGVCPICLFTPDKLVVDHCHETELVRGLLCRQCNGAIGLLLDNPEVLQRAADYLKKVYKNMASIEGRGFVSKVTTKDYSKGTMVKFTLAVQQKFKGKDGVEVKQSLYWSCVDFSGGEAPTEGEYLGVSGYVTLSKWEGGKDGNGGINVDVTVKSYEKLPQRDGAGGRTTPAAKRSGGGAPDAVPADPFALAGEG